MTIELLNVEAECIAIYLLEMNGFAVACVDPLWLQGVGEEGRREKNTLVDVVCGAIARQDLHGFSDDTAVG
jgi:hypothetical protein